MTEPAGYTAGYCCSYVFEHKEEIGLWLYGQNRARVKKWWFVRVPELAARIAEVEQGQAATLIIAPACQAISNNGLSRSGQDRAVILMAINLESPQQKRGAASDQAGAPALPVASDKPEPPNLTSDRTPASNRGSGVKANSQHATRQNARGSASSAGCQPNVSSASTGARLPSLPRAFHPKDNPLARRSSDQPIPQITTICAADVEPQTVSWIWPEPIASGKLTMIVVEPGVGKSQLATYLASTISRGALWPATEGPAPRGSVLVVSTEDEMADTIVPRLLVGSQMVEAERRRGPFRDDAKKRIRPWP